MELWARNCPVILPKFRLPRKFRDLLHAANLRHGTDGFTDSIPSWTSPLLYTDGIFMSTVVKKIAYLMLYFHVLLAHTIQI